MTSFTAIPLSDIKSFLSTNNQIIPPDDLQAYVIAWNLLTSNDINRVPSSISDFLIAYNLKSNNIDIPIYKASEIIMSKEDNLYDISNKFSLPQVDKARIIRILGYLNRLDNDMSLLDTLPGDIFENIFNELDCKSVLSTCEVSQSDALNKFCQRRLIPILRERIKLNTDTYTEEELIHTCKISVNNISAGDAYSMILTYNGRIRGFSRNDNINFRTDRITGLIPKLNKIVQISAGMKRAVALTANGKVYYFRKTISGPRLVSQLENIIEISSGENFFLMLRNDGKIFGAGHFSEVYLRLTDPLYFPYNVSDISSGSEHALILTTDGNVHIIGYYELKDIGSFSKIEDLNNIKQISAGSYHSLALTNNGQVYSFGRNDYGQLGLGHYDYVSGAHLIPNLTNIIAISAGNQYSLALTSDGLVYGWGKTYAIGNTSKFINIPTLIIGANNITQISAGYDHALLLKYNNLVYGFGVLTHISREESEEEESEEEESEEEESEEEESELVFIMDINK